MTTRLGNTLNVGTQPRDVLQPALTAQIIAYHSTAVHRLVETTELGLAAAAVLNTALGRISQLSRSTNCAPTSFWSARSLTLQ
jgi:hypothetical protein